ncbi:MAG: chromosomal replication initiator protein DnaA [Buchnera aphidicola (Eriosoma harunire)]
MSPLNYNNYLKFHFNKSHNFENFIEGKSNQLARSVTFKIANNTTIRRYLILLYGNSGLGKTHLLHAVGNCIFINKKNAKVIYIDCKLFLKKSMNILESNSIEVLKNYYSSIDACLIDNIHYFQYAKKNQTLLFNTLPMLLKNSQQIIATSNCYPKHIIGLEDVFKSQLKWSIVIEIHPPELHTRISILIKKANEYKILLSTKIAYLIATKFKSNIKDLENILHEIIFHSNITNQKITINFVNEILNDCKREKINISVIQQIVAQYYQIKITDLLSSSRLRSIVRPRQIAMSISKTMTNHSLSEIGYAFGKRDHTTVLHACKTIQILKKQKTIYDDWCNIIKKLSV